MTIYAYYRVSTDDQDYNNQKQGVVEFSKRQNMPIDIEVIDNGKSGALPPEKRELGQLLGILKEGDIIIASEISRISRKLFDLFTIAKYLNDKKVKIYTVKDNYTLDDSIQGQALLFAFGLASQIERDLISQRVKEALARKKKEGVKIGRPFGTNYRKCKLYDEYIRKSIEERVSINVIAKNCNCNWSTLQRYLKENNIKTYGKDVVIKRKQKTCCYDVDYSKTYVESVNNQLVSC